MLACEHCDKLLLIPELGSGERATCTRCGETADLHIERRFERAMAFSSAALVLFACALYFPFLGMAVSGVSSTMSLLEAGLGLCRNGDALLGIAVLGMVVVAPVIMMVATLVLAATARSGSDRPWRRALARVFHEIEYWNMADVFFLGVLVCLVKITAMARVEFGPSFWAYVAAAVCAWVALHSIDARAVLPAVPLRNENVDMEGTAADSGLAACHVCRTLVDAEESHACPLCGAACHVRTPASIQRTLAWLVTSVVLYVPANLLPMTQTTTLGRVSESTVAGSAVDMWHHGSYAVSLVIFIASMVIPILKMLAITRLSWAVGLGRTKNREKLARLYTLTEAVGRWSMVDVFVVALLVALIQIGSVLTIRPGAAALAFTGVVVCTMLSARSFDPRLLWDEQEPIS